MGENWDYIPVRNNSTLKESFELPLENILALKNYNALELEHMINILKNNISDFHSKYKTLGATNIKFNNNTYCFPVLTTGQHESRLFPELLEYRNTVTFNYHILTFERVKMSFPEI